VTLRHCADTTIAQWLVESPVPWHQLVEFGPGGFDAYARLRFIPDPDGPGRSENDVGLPDNHAPDLVQAQQALGILQRFTTTPEHWYFCVWEGTGYELPPSIFRRPLLDVSHRRYFLAHGSAADFQTWETAFENSSAPLPAFVWPADRSWCFASDVDPHWAGIGGALPAIEALTNSTLDIVTARPADDQPAYV
jgi:hypothetical protein